MIARLCLSLLFLALTGTRLLGQAADVATVSGMVETGRTGSAARVSLVLRDGSSGLERYQTVADERGRFTLRDVLPGTYLLEVASSRGEIVQERIHLAPGEHQQLLLRLDAATRSEGATVPLFGRIKEREQPIPSSSYAGERLTERSAFSTLPTAIGESPTAWWTQSGGDAFGLQSLYLRGFDSRRYAFLLNGVPLNDAETHAVAWSDVLGVQGELLDAQVLRSAMPSGNGASSLAGAVDVLVAGAAPESRVMVESAVGSLGRKGMAVSANAGRITGGVQLFGRIGRDVSDGYRSHSAGAAWPIMIQASRLGERSSFTALAFASPSRFDLADVGVGTDQRSKSLGRKINPRGLLGERVRRNVPTVLLGHEMELFGWRLRQDVLVRVGYVATDLDAGHRAGDQLGLAGILFAQEDPRLALPLNALFPGVRLAMREDRRLRHVSWRPQLATRGPLGETTVGLVAEVAGSRWDGAVTGNLDPLLGDESGSPGGDLSVPFLVYRFRSSVTGFSGTLRHLARLGYLFAVEGDLSVRFRRYRVFDVHAAGHAFSRGYWNTDPRLGMTVNPQGRFSGFLGIGVANRPPAISDLYRGWEAGTRSGPRFRRMADGSWDLRRPYVRGEIALDVELGLRATGKGWTARLTAFSNRVKDLISPWARVDEAGLPDVGNAGLARVRGLELDGSFRPADRLTLRGNASWLGTAYGSFTEFGIDEEGQVEAIDRSGSPLPGVPGFAGRLAATQALDWGKVGVALSKLGSRPLLRDEGREIDTGLAQGQWVPPLATFDLWVLFQPDSGPIPGSVEVRLDLRTTLSQEAVGYGILGPNGPEFFPLPMRTALLSARWTPPWP